MENIKKVYEEPAMEVIRLQSEDVICTSGGLTPPSNPAGGFNDPAADNDISFWN